MSSPSTITIHMVASLDGYIAKPDNSIDWMHTTDRYEPGLELSDEDITAFLAGIDCYVMGARTYELALELGWPYGDKPVFVLTNRKLTNERATVEFYDGDLEALANDKLRGNYKAIWMVGGSMLTKEFLRLDLADEIVISIMPVLLGNGTLFFEEIGVERRLHLKESKAYKDGMVELTYEVLKT